MATATVRFDSGFVDNWQSGKTLSDCNRHMLISEDSCDVTFRVGKDEKIVRAHRYVLISRSCVFHAMLCGPLAETDDIKIPDVEVDVFSDLLTFLYTDVSTPNHENATGLLYLAKKYAVGILERQCLSYLEKSLSTENACVILEQAHVFDEKELHDRALKIVLENGDKCLLTLGFKRLSHAVFDQVISSDKLSVKPENIFSAAVSWARGECSRQGIDMTSATLRSVIGETLYAIPFQEMDHEHYVNEIVPYQVLTKDENIAVMTCLLCSEKDPFPFKRRRPNPGKKTAAFPMKNVQEYRDIILYDGFKKKTNYKYNANTDRYNFKCNQAVSLSGVYILRSLGTEWYKLAVYNRQSNVSLCSDTIRSSTDNVFSGTDCDVVALNLKIPLAIRKDVEYVVYVKSTRGHYLVGFDGSYAKNSVDVERCTFQRTERSCDNTVNVIYGFKVQM